ncbi:MAG TPA: hypothetical protein VFM53_04500 [Anaeromyxobacteraceae bacterium]|nr:hypothetical protein [Anaeromyxobacteraceae bacterium]
MPQPPEGSAARRRSPLLLLAAVALAVAVAWLLAERNARQWWIVPEDGKVVVKKGIPFVTGKAAFQSSDPEMARTYAPLVPPSGTAPPAEASYDDRAALDQALFELLARWAREDVRSRQPERMDRARGYLERAERLAGVSAAQREELRALRSETAFGEAVEHLRQGAAALQRAQESLRLASGASGPVAVEAAALARALEPVAGATGQLMLEASRFGAEPAPGSPGAPGAAPAPREAARP